MKPVCVIRMSPQILGDERFCFKQFRRTIRVRVFRTERDTQRSVLCSGIRILAFAVRTHNQ